jgi:hypothetical protein
MRYDNGKDWVEITGVATRPMRELLVLDTGLAEAHKFMLQYTTDAHFTNAAGEVVDWRADVLGLTVQQWDWWKTRLWAAARDEKISPEA